MPLEEMLTIDTDAHFMEPIDWLERTDPDLVRDLPPQNIGAIIQTLIGGDLASSLPPELRPSIESLLPEGLASMADTVLEMTPTQAQNVIESGILPGLQPKGAFDGAERIEVLDEHGIDMQLLLPTIGFFRAIPVRRADPALALRALAAYNTWSAETVVGHTDRLLPVAMVDLNHQDWALDELRRMRAAGGRGFVFWDPAPMHGKAFAHPDNDPVWAASVELGMLPIIHVGAGRPNLDRAWMEAGGENPVAGIMLHASQGKQVPELAITSMIYGGVFERFPELRVLVAEQGVKWVAGWLDALDDALDEGIVTAMGGWPYPLKPSEYARRNVRITPLDGESGAEAIDKVGPGMFVFSSDWPHPEGPDGAVDHYREHLIPRFDDATVRAFFGETIAQDLGLRVPSPV